MDYSKKQSQLDVKKWVDSEIKGYDTCGSYDYCSSCNKSEAYPCACAYEKYSAITKLAKTTTTKTSSTGTAKKSTKTSTGTTKKSTSTKSTTSKSTSSSTRKRTTKTSTTDTTTVTA